MSTTAITIMFLVLFVASYLFYKLCMHIQGTVISSKRRLTMSERIRAMATILTMLLGNSAMWLTFVYIVESSKGKAFDLTGVAPFLALMMCIPGVLAAVGDIYHNLRSYSK